MSKLNEIAKSLSGKLTTMLSGRPMWAFWAVYTVLSGIIFGVSYTLMYFLLLRWWVATVAVVAIGMIWGNSAHKKKELGETSEQES